MSLRYPNLTDDEESEVDESDRFPGFTAIYEACSHGDSRILERLGPDPSRDDFDELFAADRSGAIVKVLARSRSPHDAGKVIRSQLWWIALHFGRTPSLDTIEALFATGARWESSSATEIGDVRRSLLKMSDYTFVEAMKLLARDEHCSQAILQQLGRTPTIRARMKRVGFFPSPPDEKKRYDDQPHPTRSRSEQS